MFKKNISKSMGGSLFIAIITLLLVVGQTPLYAVKSSKASANTPVYHTVKKAPPIPPAVVSKFEKKAKNAILFSALGVAMVIGVVAVLSFGAMSGALPLLAIGALFANIGFIKAMRLRQQTKSRKKVFRKARDRSKTAIILSCVLGITLIFGILSILLNKADTF